MNIAALAFFAVLLVGAASLRWRWAFYGALVTAVIEGALRKWVFPGAGNFIYFAKDLLLLGAYLGFAFQRPLIHPVPLHGATLIWIMCALFGVQLANPNSNSILLSLIGIKPYLFYLPLIYLTQFVFRTRREFETFLRWFVLLALPVFLLGAFQFTLSPDSVWNKYAIESEETDVATFGEGEFARITSTFSYISGLTTYILLIAALAMPLALFDRRRRWRLSFAAVLVLAVGNTFMSGSRSPVAGLALMVIGFWLVTQTLGTAAEIRRAPMHLLVGAVAIVAAVNLFEKAVTAIKDRATENFEEGQTRVFQYFTEPWALAEFGGVFGYGAGLTLGPTIGLQKALHLSDAKETPPPLEVESSRVMVEVGLPTFVVWHVFRLYVLYALWRTYSRLRDPLLRQLALGAFLASLYYLSTGIVVNHVAGLFNWFLAGFICLLPRLDAEKAPEPTAVKSKAKRRGRLPTIPPDLTPQPGAVAARPAP